MSANATVGVLRVLLTASTADYESGMKRASTIASAFAKQTKIAGAQLSAAGRTLTTGLTIPMIGVGVAAMKAGLDFGKVINTISGVLRPTADQMERVRATAIKMGADTAFSATESAQAILELGRAGFDTEAAIGSVGKVLELAAASGLNMGDAASMAARTLNAFGMSAGDLGHVNDVLAAAVNKTSLEIGDMQVAFGYVGPIARGFGMSIEEVSAALGIMRDSGIAAETTGRALREGFSRLANPVKSVEEVMAELGISSFESNGKLMGLTEVVGLLQGKGITAAQSLKLFGDAAGPGMYALIQKGQQGLIDLTTELEKSTGASKAMSDEMKKGLPGAMQRLEGSVETARLALSEALEPAIVGVMDTVGDLADVVTNDLVPAFKALPGPVQSTALGLAGIGVVAGPALWAFGQIATGASALVGLFGKAGVATKALGTAFSIASSPIGLIVGAIGGVALAWAKFTGDWTRAFDVLLPPLGIFRIGLDSAKTALAPHLPLIRDLASIITNGLVVAWHTARDAMASVRDTVLPFVAEKLGMVSSAVQTLTSWVRDKLPDAFKSMRETFDPLFKVEAFLKRWADRSKLSIGEVATGMQELADKGRTGGPLMATFFTNATVGFSTLGTAATGARPPVQRLDEELEAAAKAAEKFADSLKELGGANAIAGARMIQKQLETLGGPLKVMPDQLEDMAAGLREGAQAAMLLGKYRLAAEFEAQAKTLEPMTVFQQRWNVKIGEYVPIARDAAAETAALNDQIAVLGGTAVQVGPVLENSMTDAMKGLGASGAAMQNLTGFRAAFKSSFEEMATVGSESVNRMIDTIAGRISDVTGSLTSLLFGAGHDVDGSLKRTASEATRTYLEISSSGKASADQIADAYAAMQEAVDRANFTMGERFEQLWDRMKAAAFRAFDDILAGFMNRVVRGIGGTLMGQQGAWSQAFAGMLGRGAAGGGGIGAVAGGSPWGVTPFAGGGSTAAGAGGAGAGAAVMGGASAAMAGFAMGKWGQEIFGGAGWKAGGFGAAGGAATGAMIGSVLPGIGTAVGAIVGGLAGMAAGFIGTSKQVKDTRKAVADYQVQIRASLTDEQKAQAGGEAWKETVIGVRDAYLATGRTAEDATDAVSRMWNTGNPEQAIAAVREIDAVMEQYAKKMLALAEGKKTATGIVDEILAGGAAIPAALQPSIDKMIELGLLTDEQKDKLRGLGTDAGPSLQQMEAALGVIKGNVETLGPAFRQAKMDETAGSYLNAITTLLRGTDNIGAVLFDAREELGQLVKDSLKLGTTIPANMKPWIEDLLASGNLIDANGEKITDISQVKWGEPMKTEAEIAAEGWSKILDKIDALISRIAGPLETEIDRVTRDREVNIDVNTRTRNESGNNETQPATDPGYFAGTIGRHGAFWRDFGAGTSTALHGIEAVLRPQDALPFSLATLASLGLAGADGGAGGSGGPTTNLVLVPVLMGEGMDPATLTDQIVRRIPGNISFQSGPLRQGIERIVSDWDRSYRRG